MNYIQYIKNKLKKTLKKNQANTFSRHQENSKIEQKTFSHLLPQSKLKPNTIRINKKKTKLIMGSFAMLVFLIVVFGVLKPQNKKSKALKVVEQGSNINIPADFIITGDDYKRLREATNENAADRNIEELANRDLQENNDTVRVPDDYFIQNNDRVQNPAQNLRAYTQNQLLRSQEGIQVKTQGLYVSNWNSSSKSSNPLAKLGSIAGLNSLSSLTKATNGSNNIAEALGNAQNSYLGQNAQKAKKTFLNTSQAAQATKTEYAQLQKPISPYTIMAGSVIPITLITGINSDLPGDIVAQVNRNVYDTVTSNYVLIPAGAKVVGKYDSGVTWGQKRVLVIWSRLVLPNGNSLDLRGMQGVDLAGYAGYSDRVDAHVGEIVATVLASTVLNIGTSQLGALSSSQTNKQVQALTDALTNGANNTAGMLAKIADKIINVQPTIKIRHGKRASIFVGKDLILQPYIKRY